MQPEWEDIVSESESREGSVGGKFKVAKDIDFTNDLIEVHAVSAFADAMHSLFGKIRPRKIIETGTLLGMGSTAIIASALKELVQAGHVTDPVFYTIEVNPQNYEQVNGNLKSQGLADYVRPLMGLSVPRALLPSVEELELLFVKNIGDSFPGSGGLGDKDGAHADIFVDHREDERAERYYRETDFPGVRDDLLGKCLADFDYKPDFVLLDSAGHLGYVEFNYLIERLRGDCYIALDDVYHVKHYRSLLKLKQDQRFELLSESREKFGFCIARFSPGISRPKNGS